ncbi:MAG: hypothetical protein QOK49_1194, partial [Baekduia sp.]|nr:hypothetical protein [Baekduia sp.]
GLSYREIGERLGMSRPSVESTLFRARRRLTEEYEELVTGERCLRIQSIISGAGTRSALGVRDQRRVGSHISYCQPCRKQAIVAGLDAAAMARRPARAKIAAFLPLPAFLRRRWLPGGGTDAAAAQAAQHGTSLAQLSMAAAQYGEPTMAGWMKATAIATALAVAGVGVGAADHAARHGGPGAQGTRVVQRAAQGGGGGGASTHATAPGAHATPTRTVASAGGRSAAGAAGRSGTGTPTAGSGAVTGSGSGSSTPGLAGSPASSGSGAGAGTAPSTDPIARAKVPTRKPPRVAVAGAGTAAGAVQQAVTGTTGAAGGAPASAAPLVQPDLTPLTQAPASTAPPSSAGQAVQNTTNAVGEAVGGQVGGAVKDTGAAAGNAVDQVTGAVGGAVGGVLGGK